MTDLTTPVLEDADMNKFVSLLTRAADAIVAQSTMAKQVAEYQSYLSSLHAEIDTLRSAKSILENTVSELYDVKHSLSEVQARLDARNRENEDYLHQIAQLTDSLESTRKERDEHHFALLQANDDLHSINARHAKLKALLIGDPVQTQAQSIPITESVPTPPYISPPAMQAINDPTPLITPAPTKPWWDVPIRDEPAPTPITDDDFHSADKPF